MSEPYEPGGPRWVPRVPDAAFRAAWGPCAGITHWGDWFLAPAAMDFTEAATWAHDIGATASIALSSGDTLVCCPLAIDDTIVEGAECACEFQVDPDEPDETPETAWHYRRRCPSCRQTWWGLHCPHDGIQKPCMHCGATPPPLSRR